MLRMLTRPRRAAVLAVPLLLLAACASEETATVPLDRIVGRWQGADGEALSFSSDRTFTSSGLDSGKLADSKCPGGPSKGSWGFFTDGDSGTQVSKTTKSGSWIGLGFERRFWQCGLLLAVVDDGRTLCATDDPDTPCGLDVRFTRRK
ncbi:lipoprotein [Streptomyces rameus]|uniref:Lipoprotein n=2 Tax=Streptomyces rameus TaxID=68261 RepID=A0ABP6MVZ1_9ACTN